MLSEITWFASQIVDRFSSPEPETFDSSYTQAVTFPSPSNPTSTPYSESASTGQANQREGNIEFDQNYDAGPFDLAVNRQTGSDGQGSHERMTIQFEGEDGSNVGSVEIDAERDQITIKDRSGPTEKVEVIDYDPFAQNGEDDFGSWLWDGRDRALAEGRADTTNLVNFSDGRYTKFELAVGSNHTITVEAADNSVDSYVADADSNVGYEVGKNGLKVTVENHQDRHRRKPSAEADMVITTGHEEGADGTKYSRVASVYSNYRSGRDQYGTARNAHTFAPPDITPANAGDMEKSIIAEDGRSIAVMANASDPAPTGGFILEGNMSKSERQALFDESVTYLKRDPGMAKIIADIEKSDRPITIIMNNERDNSSIPSRNVVYWDPHAALAIQEGGSLSPALILGHELAHVHHDMENRRQMLQDNTVQLIGYDTLEEKRTIQGPENSAARTLGEGIRSSHYGAGYIPVDAPTASPA